MNYYTHKIGNKLKVGPEKPKPEDYVDDPGDVNEFVLKQWDFDLKDWEASLMDVENICCYQNEDRQWVYYIDPEQSGGMYGYPYFQRLTPGQRVAITKTGKGCRITKII